MGPFDFRAAADLLRFRDPVDTLTAYGILGRVPLYLSLFNPKLSIEQNIATHVADPGARLYVEPDAVFAADHQSYDRIQALSVLRAIAEGNREYSRIEQRSGVPHGSFPRVLEPLIGDLGWSGGEICSAWVRLAVAAGQLDVSLTKVGTWWNATDEVDVLGLDAQGRVLLAGEAKWRNQGFGWDDLEKYLNHLRAMGDIVRPDVRHVLFSKVEFQPRVAKWAQETGAMLLRPRQLLGALDQTGGRRSRP